MRNFKGFTLIELLLVLALIIFIGALSFPWLRVIQVKSQLRSAAQQLQSELYNTRLTAMKSGNAYVFRFQGGTGDYEILPKSVWDEQSKHLKQNQPQNDLNSDQMGLESVRAVGSADQTFGESAPLLLQNQMQIPALETSSFGSAKRTESFMKELPNKIIFEPTTLKPEKRNSLNSPGLETVRTVGTETPETLLPATSDASSFTVSGLGVNPSGTQSAWSDPIIFYPNGRTSSSSFGICTTKGFDYRCDITLRGLTGTARIHKPE